MCGRYVLGMTPEELYERFGVAEISETRIPAVPPRFNVAPSQAVPVVVAHPEGRALATMRWGFRPGWMKDAGKRPPPMNARAETIIERPMFRTSVPRHRCILPATGFYEWQALPGQKAKQPWHFRLQDGALFGFAGLYAESDDGPTCAIVTTAANELVGPVHDRMPVILSPDDEALWLDLDATDPGDVLPLLAPYPAKLMEAFPVGTAVNAVGNDGPDLLMPLNSA